MPRCHDHAKILGELEVVQQAQAVVGPVASGGVLVAGRSQTRPMVIFQLNRVATVPPSR
jgi:hypothetical protein